MKARLLIAGTLITLLCGPALAFATAQVVAVRPEVRTAAEAISASRIQRDVEYLSSDALGGRDTFSPGLDTAAGYIVRRLERAGLRPLGDSGTFLQHYSVIGVAADTAGVYLTANGQRFGFGDLVIATVRRAISVEVSVVYVGHGFRIPSLNVDPYRGMDLHGKFVLVGGALPRGLTFETLPADAEVPRFAAERAGALGVMLIAQPPAMLDNFRGGWRSRDIDVTEPLTAGLGPTRLVLKSNVARALFGGDTVRANAAFAGAPVPSFELPHKATIVIPATEQRRIRYNIVAMIPGADPLLREEYVTFGAHLDGVAGPGVAGDTIFNAADDNASGSAAILAVAEALMRAPRPRRSIAFIWSTGHEIGLLGTRYFVAQNTVPPTSIVAHVNVDMVGTSRAPGRADSASADVTEPNEIYVTGPRVLSTELDTLVETTNEAFLQMRLNHRYDTPDSPFIYPRTDARPFVERGVPIIAFMTGFHPRYHRPQDEAAYIDPQKISAVSKTALVIAWTLADVLERPRVDKGYPPRVPQFR